MLVTMTPVLLLFAALLAAIPEARCDETALFRNLTQDYVRHVRPIKHHSDVINVQLAYELMKILNVDEKTQVITLMGFFAAIWQDEFLTWRPADWGGVELMIMPPNMIWIPDIGLENSAGNFYHTTFLNDFRCRVRHDGRVIWTFGGQISTICPLDMTYYPFDLQHCEVQMENWAYEGHEVDLHQMHDYVDLEVYEENGVWAMDHTNVTRAVHTYHVTGDIPFPEVSFHLYIRRKSLFYLLNLVIPCTFIIAVALGVYWLPPDSGEKVTLGITVLLAFSVFLLVIAQSTPETSDFSPILGRLVATIMGLATMSVLTSILVLYVHHKHARRRVPAWLRTLAFRGLSRLLCMCMSLPLVGGRGDKVAAADKVTSDRGDPQSPVHVQVVDVADLEEKSGQQHTLAGDDARDIRAIRDQLSFIVERCRQHDAEEDIKGEWKALGKVIDRLFFWLSLLSIVVVLSVFTTQKDQTH